MIPPVIERCDRMGHPMVHISPEMDDEKYIVCGNSVRFGNG